MTQVSPCGQLSEVHTPLNPLAPPESGGHTNMFSALSRPEVVTAYLSRMLGPFSPGEPPTVSVW